MSEGSNAAITSAWAGSRVSSECARAESMRALATLSFGHTLTSVFASIVAPPAVAMWTSSCDLSGDKRSARMSAGRSSSDSTKGGSSLGYSARTLTAQASATTCAEGARDASACTSRATTAAGSSGMGPMQSSAVASFAMLA